MREEYMRLFVGKGVSRNRVKHESLSNHTKKLNAEGRGDRTFEVLLCLLRRTRGKIGAH